MKTYGELLSIFSRFTYNDSAENQALGGTLINDALREVLDARNWTFKEAETTITTVADQQFYEIPNDVDKIQTINVTVSGTEYQPCEISTKKEWDYINSTDSTSDIATYYFIFDGKLGIYPIPSSSGNSIEVTYQKKYVPLTISNYETGTITSIANGDTTVTGSGTAWTDQMEGSVIFFDKSYTANTGDNRWYFIDSVTDGTHLELEKPYLGNSISAGTADYRIGQVSILPDEYQIMPVYKACYVYFTTIQPEPARAQMFQNMYQESIEAMKSGQEKSSDPVINLYNGGIINPNNYYIV